MAMDDGAAGAGAGGSSSPAPMSMEAWLRQQAEKAQARVVVTKHALAVSQARFFSVQRLTNSDVVSVITTTRPSTALVEDLSVSAERKNHLRDAQYTSPLRNEEILKREERDRRNRALWREADLFLGRLHKKRSDREQVETRAATKIQTQFRGWRWRKFIKRERKKKTVRLRLRSRVKFLNKSMGMVIQEREKKQRILEMQKRAVVGIQKVGRGFLARRAANKERQMLQEEVLIMLATRIQCMARKRLARRAVKLARQRSSFEKRFLAVVVIQKNYRGRLGRRQFWLKTIELEHVAAVLCQRRFRVHLACKAARKEREFRDLESTNAGALEMQRMWRGKLARRRVFDIRNREEQQLKEAASLSVQRAYRGHLGRQLVRDIIMRQDAEDETIACILIQAQFRGWKGRREFRDEADRQLSNVFDQARLGHHEAVKDLLAGWGTEDYSIDSTDDDGNTVLLVAARWGHKKIVRNCLRRGMDINHQNDAGLSATHLGVIHGHDEVAEYLITKEAELNFFGRTLLHEAASRGQTSVVSTLIGAAVPLDERDENGMTALHEAALNGHVDTTQLLIDRAAGLDVLDVHTHTPLMAAAAKGQAGTVQCLIAAGADVAIKDSENRTAWRLALANEHAQCAHLLRQAWAEVVGAEHEQVASMAASEEDRANIWKYALDNNLIEVEAIIDRGMPVDYVDDKANTVLMAAARAGSTRVCRLCVRRGANVRRTNSDGQTALHMAAMVDHELAEYLAQEGGEVNAVDSAGRTPMHEGALHGWVFEGPIKVGGIDVNVVDMKGNSPLHEAAGAAHKDACQTLIRLGARVTLVDNRGETPLSRAAAHPKGKDTAEFLLSKGANVNHPNNNGDMPLHICVKRGLVDNAAIMLEGGADPSAINGDGYTPVRLACKAETSTMLALLLQYGADPNKANADGRTPLAVAVLEHSLECTRLLLQHGADVLESYADGSTPLHLAAQTGFAGAVPLILEATHMASYLLQQTNGRGDVPVMSGVRAGEDGALDVLVKAGSVLKGYSVHIAAAAPKSAALRWLLKAGDVDLNELDAAGLTALHRAASVGRVANLRVLVEAGADEDKGDRHGATPLQAANAARQTNAVEYLMHHHAAVEGEEDDTGAAEVFAGKGTSGVNDPFHKPATDLDEEGMYEALGLS